MRESSPYFKYSMSNTKQTHGEAEIRIAEQISTQFKAHIGLWESFLLQERLTIQVVYYSKTRVGRWFFDWYQEWI